VKQPPQHNLAVVLVAMHPGRQQHRGAVPPPSTAIGTGMTP